MPARDRGGKLVASSLRPGLREFAVESWLLSRPPSRRNAAWFWERDESKLPAGELVFVGGYPGRKGIEVDWASGGGILGAPAAAVLDTLLWPVLSLNDGRPGGGRLPIT